MNWSQLPPVGTPVPLDADNSSDPLGPYTGSAVLTASGTAALALTIKVAMLAQPGISAPEVIIPAYGCPDLVAAIVHAGATPVITDIAAMPYHYPVESLRLAVSERTVALICPTLLGIRLDLPALKNQLPEHCLLIEDNAQWFPEVISADIAEHSQKMLSFTDKNLAIADMSIVSFGRGKPVNLLGGGAAFLHNTALESVFNQVNVSAAQQVSAKQFEIKAHGFNALLHPSLYGGLTKLPIGLGETVYHELTDIQALDDTRRERVHRGIIRYRTLPTYAEDRLRKQFPKNPLLSQVRERLLRYPLMFDSKESRDSAHDILVAKGLGASCFYNAILPAISGVPGSVVVRGEITHAHTLADTLLTLPVHPGVSEIHTHAMMRYLSEFSDHLIIQ